MRRQDVVLWATFMHENFRAAQFVSVVSENPIYGVFRKDQINFILKYEKNAFFDISLPNLQN